MCRIFLCLLYFTCSCVVALSERHNFPNTPKFVDVNVGTPSGSSDLCGWINRVIKLNHHRTRSISPSNYLHDYHEIESQYNAHQRLQLRFALALFASLLCVGNQMKMVEHDAQLRNVLLHEQNE